MYTLRIVLDSVAPISVNDAYSTGRGGARFITKAGQAYKDALKEAAIDAIHNYEGDWSQAVAAVYERGGQCEVATFLYLPSKDLRNGSWKPGKSTPTGLPSSPWKSRDVGNYVKLTIDAITDAVGIDDCCNFTEHAYKAIDDVGLPRVEILYIVYEPEVQR